LNLNVLRVPFHVYMSRRWANGWRFGTRPGHPDYPGWIEFKFTRSRNGHMNLRVHSYVPDYSLAAACGFFNVGCWLLRKRIYRGVANRTWAPFADNLRAQGW